MRNEAPAGAAKTAAMNRAATLCGCAALCYLVARTGLTLLAGALLALRVPGASLSNPVGTGLLAATLLRGAVAAAALVCPFLLLLIAPQPPVPVHRGGYGYYGYGRYGYGKYGGRYGSRYGGDNQEDIEVDTEDGR